MQTPVYKHDLMQVMVAIEEAAVQIRELFQDLPGEDPLGKIDSPMPDQHIVVAVPGLDEDPPSVGDVPPIVYSNPCVVLHPAGSSCNPTPGGGLCSILGRDAGDLIEIGDVYRAARRMEILAAACRYTLGRLNQTMLLRPAEADG
jgi:hypothetical protein